MIKNTFLKYRELILYLFFGGLTTLVNIISYWSFVNLLDIDFLMSNAIAWVLSVLFAYVTNKIFVFESKSSGLLPIIKELFTFVGFRLLSGLVDMAVMFLGVSFIGLDDLFVKIIANIIVVILNYIFSKLIIFKNK